MDMTWEEQIKAFRMLASGMEFEDIARELFPEAYENAPNLTVELLRGTMHSWYKKQSPMYLQSLMN